ncbi:hypothetical protein [Propioniciclava sinopodophylli]|uniref:hypothetical protein n=1 Tax=Propioniciclava sinopodophylli TaxID=1837344 RepID=UPI001F500380|nr:hypothetical protein [Propioniciclava sinopodophylli]
MTRSRGWMPRAAAASSNEFTRPWRVTSWSSLRAVTASMAGVVASVALMRATYNP